MNYHNIPFRSKSEARQGKLNPIFDVGHTDTAKEKMSAAYLNGRSVGFHKNKWGNVSEYTSPLQGIIMLRSNWEVATANFLSKLGYDWMYEYKTFKLNKTVSYTPDFYIPSENVYIEVKGRLNDYSLKKLELFRAQGNSILLWDAEELLKRGIITNSGDSNLNRKYRNIEPYNGLY